MTSYSKEDSRSRDDIVEQFRRDYVAPALGALVSGEPIHWGPSVSRNARVASDRVTTGGSTESSGASLRKRAYLAHPFAEKQKVEAEFQPKLEAMGIDIINPFQRAEQKMYEKALGTAEGLTMAHAADIVNKDLEKIDDAGAIIALMIHDRMLGTIMEIFFSSYMRKYPTFVYAPSERYSKHPWIMHLSTVSTTWSMLEEQLSNWQKS